MVDSPCTPLQTFKIKTQTYAALSNSIFFIDFLRDRSLFQIKVPQPRSEIIYIIVWRATVGRTTNVSVPAAAMQNTVRTHKCHIKFGRPRYRRVALCGPKELQKPLAICFLLIITSCTFILQAFTEFKRGVFTVK